MSLTAGAHDGGVEAAVREAGYKMKRPLLHVLWGNLLEATETLPLDEAMRQCLWHLRTLF